MNRPLLPPAPLRMQGFGDADGAVIAHAGRYSRECVLLAFEMIGGVERMAAWADKNPGDFYTKLFGKVITREVEWNTGQGIEELLAKLDSGAHANGSPHPITDAEYTIDE